MEKGEKEKGMGKNWGQALGKKLFQKLKFWNSLNYKKIKKILDSMKIHGIMTFQENVFLTN
jgi:hypothetical protein